VRTKQQQRVVITRRRSGWWGEYRGPLVRYCIDEVEASTFKTSRNASVLLF